MNNDINQDKKLGQQGQHGQKDQTTPGQGQKHASPQDNKQGGFGQSQKPNQGSTEKGGIGGSEKR